MMRFFSPTAVTSAAATTTTATPPSDNSIIVSLLCICAFAIALVYSRERREQSYEQWKQRNVVVVIGKVLVADCEYDAESDRVVCHQLIVEFPDEENGGVRRQSFMSLRKDDETPRDLENIPRSGSEVIVSYRRGRPDTASVSRL